MVTQFFSMSQRAGMSQIFGISQRTGERTVLELIGG